MKLRLHSFLHAVFSQNAWHDRNDASTSCLGQSSELAIAELELTALAMPYGQNMKRATPGYFPLEAGDEIP
ncbi:MAG: hypothetical protein P4N60_13655 [Verrucomicrobiae bacterium]|nr:hypothetical protein [Verrucomicrobiae bacterium]